MWLECKASLTMTILRYATVCWVRGHQQLNNAAMCMMGKESSTMPILRYAVSC